MTGRTLRGPAIAFFLALVATSHGEAPEAPFVLGARAETGRSPKSVTVSPDGRTLLVANFFNRTADNVAFYDARTLGLLGTVSFDGNAVESAWSPDGRFAYVSDFAHHRVLTLEVASRRIVREARTGCRHPKVLVRSPEGETLYVSCWDGEVVALDVRSGEVRARAFAGREPRGLALSSDGRHLFVASHGSHELYLLETPTLRRVRRAALDPRSFPRHLALSPDGARLYVSTLARGLVYEIEARSLRIRRRIAVGACPKTIVVSPDGTRLYAANFCSDDVAVVDLVTHRVERIALDRTRASCGLALGRDGRLFVTGWASNELVALVRAGTPSPPTPSPSP